MEQQAGLASEVRHLSSLVKTVSDNQLMCPARRREMVRIDRRAEWKVYGKLFAWMLSLAGAGFGVVKVIIELWG